MKRDSPPAESPIQIERGWRAWRGHAFGLGPSAMRGIVHIAPPPDIDFRSLDDALVPLLDNDAPTLRLAGDPGEDLLERLLAWSIAAQRSQKVPLLGPHKVLSIVRGERRATFDVAVPMHAPGAWNETLTWFIGTVNSLVQGAAPSATELAASYDAMLRRLDPFALAGTNNFHLLNAAHALGIPSRLVMSGTICLGLAARSRWMNSTLTDRTPALAAQIAHSKLATVQVMRMHGLPVPQHVVVRDEAAAQEAARRLGWPVVVKPDDQEQGRGVAAGLEDDSALAAAYRAAAAISSTVLVERHHFGFDHRFYVMDGEVINILRREPGRVEGDGVHSVAELVEGLHQTPRYRKMHRQTGKWLLELDAEANALLQAQGLAPDSVPAPGRRVVLRRKSNLSTGGVQTLVDPATAHPDNLDLAVRATEALGLDICGVDMILPDVTRSWRETGAVVIEVNAKPQFSFTAAPEVYRVAVGKLIEGDGRIPVHLVVQDLADIASLVSSASAIGVNGISCAQGLWLDGRPITTDVRDTFEAARMLLLNRRVHGAMCVMRPADVLRCGLPVDRVASMRVVGSVPPQDMDLLRLIARDHCEGAIQVESAA